jgi:hypothetical protein
MTQRIGIVIALLAALGGGWLWGASGRQDVDRALAAVELRNDLLEAHAALLGARVNLYEGDLVAMARQLEHARTLVERAAPRLGTTNGRGEPRPLDLQAFGSEIDDAQRLAASLDAQVRPASPR